MNLRPTAKSVYDPVYRANYFLIVSRPQDFHPTLRKLLRPTSLRPDTEELVRLTSADLLENNGRCFRLSPRVKGKTQSVIVMWVRAGTDVSVLVHEILHAVIWVFGDRGAHVDQDNDEAFTYYVQWLIRWSLGLRQ